MYIHHYTICISIICFIGKAGEGGDEFSKFLKKKGGEGGVHSDFFNKKGGASKMVNVVVSLIFTVTNLLQCYFYLIVWCVCFVYIHHYTFYQYHLFYRKSGGGGRGRG